MSSGPEPRSDEAGAKVPERSRRTLSARLFQVLQVLFFPQSCVLCGRWVANPDASPLCAECFLRLPRFRSSLCPICGVPAPAGDLPFPNREADPGAPEPCPSCRGQRTFHHSTRAWGPYAGTLRELIHRFKFSGHRRLAHPLASLLERAYDARPDPFSPSCLVPVPSHPRRRRKRGFDQTLFLTRTLGRRLDLPVFPGLRRSRPTLPQFGLDSKARRRNVRNAFRLRQARRLKGQDLVLVDDILTTGATSREICKVLKRDGQAGRILILTVARVVQWSGDFLVAEEYPCCK